jgi:predicted O-methyltransferase YrrM
MTQLFDPVIKLPPIVAEHGSLTPMEKSLLAHFIMLVRPRILLELGVYHARTTEFMCGVIEANALDCTLYGFDMPAMIDKLRAENEQVRALEQRGVLRLVPGMLPDALRQWLHGHPQPLDLILVDAKHDYWSVSGELRLLWSRLSPHGFILCHDYSPKYDGVRYAVHQFAARHGAMMLPLHSTPDADAHGHGSVLVVLTRSRAHFSLHSRARHHARALRYQLKRIPVIATIWRYLRPNTRS